MSRSGSDDPAHERLPGKPASAVLGAGWRRSPFPAPDDTAIARTLVTALVQIADTWPDSAAVIDQGTTVTFAELTRRIGGLAAQIRSAGAPDGPVALLQMVGTDVVAAWFACASAGRSFLLLEPSNPPERNRAMMDRAGIRILVTDNMPEPAMVAGLAHIVVLHPDGRLADLEPDHGLALDEPAMIFPTSGSTGEPKLITYSASTLQAKIQASIPLMGASPGDRVLIAGSHSNYGFLHHAMVFLLSGGTLCLADLSTGSLAEVFETIRVNRVRNLRFTPSLFRVAATHPSGLAALQALGSVRFSGEPLLAADLELARKVLAPDCRIQNIYGSTESALFVWTDDRNRPVTSHTVPIGQIYPLWEFSIRNDDGTPVPAGELGELTISSPHQALGDWQGGAVDATRFPDDPRGGQRRLYHTGDIVQSGRDGNLLLQGRKDRLVKINGLRVSLDEIESHLREMPGCAGATVLRWEGHSGNRLAAFLVGDEGRRSASDIAAWLGVRLAQHMIPARFIWLSAMPLLPGGKVDSKALLAGLPIEEFRRDKVETSYPLEDLATLWRGLLNLPEVDADADFFGLGGDSLLMLQLQLTVQQRFGRAFSREGFIAQPTLRGLAILLGLAPRQRHNAQKQDMAMVFKLVRLADGQRQGTAICMPGFRGSTQKELLIKSSLFTDYDLWACEVRFAAGSVMRGRRWLNTAIAAAEQIDQGIAPAPDVVFGFSIGGYMAWLVARLLAATAARPCRVVAIDTMPMHRSFRYRSAGLARVLARTAQTRVDVLDVRRKIPSPFQPSSGVPIAWQAQDGNILTIPVGMLEHLDMIKASALDRIADAVNTFCDGTLRSGLDVLPIDDGTVFSSAVYELLETADNPDLAKLDDLLAKPEAFTGQLALSALLFVVLSHAAMDKSAVFCSQLCKLHPELAAAHYAKAQLARLLRTKATLPSPSQASTLPEKTTSLPSFYAIDLALDRHLCRPAFSRSARTLMRVAACLHVAGPMIRRWIATLAAKILV